ncbi:hypothetical protein ZHAS_00009812 [Anopheles sinensis]|uniref:Peptidase S1 domain-containing protein n=1 Tax=Anopheles sinensis TaxID=74873 RepID=A0A084VW04_ANOSI|nr:hypothetical protein ZHAS_00009812 [Anopheles sinensis]
MSSAQDRTRLSSLALLVIVVCSAGECREYQNVITVRQAAIFLSLTPVEIKYDVYNCTSEVKLIVGGEAANYGEFPHQAMLGFPQEDDPQKVEFLCGGTLISERHVLTAAHCFAEKNATVVRLGEYDTKLHTDHEVEIPIDGIRKHPHHRNSASYHDIALIRLKTPVKLSKHIRPACLWDSEHRNTTTVIATGFGLEDFTGKPSTVLRKVQLVEYPVEDCAEKFKFLRRFRHGINDGQMCVGSIGDNITDTCSGDSGGPLQVLNFAKSCTYHVVGITSTGNVCGVECNEYQNITLVSGRVAPLQLYSTPIVFTIHNCTHVEQLIVGGEPARHGEFPHHALLGYPKNGMEHDYEFPCGGSLISDQHVLTAAHCFKNKIPTVVRLGEYDTSQVSVDELQINIAGFILHPNYSNLKSYNDIALVKLAEKVEFTKFIRPACLWVTEHRNTPWYIATGFGQYIPYEGQTSKLLRKVKLQEFPTGDCTETYKNDKKLKEGVRDSQLCVGDTVEGRDTCEGDSGGPLHTVNTSKNCIYHVAGITSVGRSGCGIGIAKAIYTKVSYYIDWIEDNVWGAKCNEYQRITLASGRLFPLTIHSEPIRHEIHNCTNADQLIAGGEPARYGEFPHHALLGYPKNDSMGDYEFLCGGTLISDQHVLTAAHCFKFNSPTVVRLGEYDITQVSKDEAQINIAGFILHPKYSNLKAYHDIALVKLADKVEFTKFIRPACLWDKNVPNTSWYIATGFGMYDNIDIKQSSIMRKVKLRVFVHDACKKPYKHDMRLREGLHDSQLCVGDTVEGRDTCKGDSGGPLQMINTPNTCIFHVVGITSRGPKGCGVGKTKAIYTKVSYYIDWIEENVWGPNAENPGIYSSILKFPGGQRLAVRKCEEYQKITLVSGRLAPLTLHSSLIAHENHNCTNVDQLIVGGEPARYGEFPHHALLGYPKNDSTGDYEFDCGGTLISDQHVLTAAHCFKFDVPSVVRLGEYDTSQVSVDELQINIAGFILHPNYNNLKSYNDIALVKLAEKVEFTKFIRPACLWVTEQRNTPWYIATGFGQYIPYEGQTSKLLRKVKLQEFPTGDCNETYKNDKKLKEGIRDSQLCVGDTVEGRDTCAGDLGGPLHIVNTSKNCIFHVAGITSVGKLGCGIGIAKSIYTKVSYYIDWIEENVWGPNAENPGIYSSILKFPGGQRLAVTK